MGRVFIIGIDGGEFRVIDRLAAAGELTEISSLMREGLRRDLVSTTPPLTPAAWASFYTGTNPGRHGVVDFLARREGSYRLGPVHRTMVSGLPLWRAAGEAGRTSLVVNLPVTYPPDELDGWMVSGMDTPGPHNAYTFPPDLKPRILEKFPGYRPDVHVSRHDLRHRKDLREWYAREVLALEAQRMELVLHLAGGLPWDLGIAVFVATDRLQHVFWSSVEESLAGGTIPPPDDPDGAVFEAYRAADRFIGRLRQFLRAEDHLIVMSDHGFGPLDKDVDLNALLARLGFLRFREQPAPSSLGRRLAASAKASLPRPLRDLLWRLLPPPEAKRVEGLSALEESVDWEATRAYAVGYLGGIYLNLKGREPRGTVRPEEANAVLDELSAALAAFRDPDDGAPLVTRIDRGRDLYHGARAAALPDLVLTLKDHRCATRHAAGGPGRRLFSHAQEDFGPLSHTGNHRPEGILIVAGPALKGLNVPAKPSIMDLYPTCLELLGIAPTWPLDGRSLLGGVVEAPPGATAGDETPQPPRSGSSLSPEEERQVLGNLRDLGYF